MIISYGHYRFQCCFFFVKHKQKHLANMNAIGVQNSLIKKGLFHYISKKKKIEHFYTQPLEKSQLTIL